MKVKELLEEAKQQLEQDDRKKAIELIKQRLVGQRCQETVDRISEEAYKKFLEKDVKKLIEEEGEPVTYKR